MAATTVRSAPRPWTSRVAAGAALLAVTVASQAQENPDRPIALKDVQSWVLQFQDLEKSGAVATLASTSYDLLVVEPTGTYRNLRKFDMKEMVGRLREGKRGRLVLAYLDIAEADSHRSYWGKGWRAPRGSERGQPDFLLKPDPDGWQDTYVAAFHDPRWQALVLEDVKSVMPAGFDGLYLDWVEGYRDPDAAASARAAGLDSAKCMSDFVLRIRDVARKIRPGALVVAQNGAGLAEQEPAFLDRVDGFALEGAWFRGKAEAAWSDRAGGDLAAEGGEEALGSRVAPYAKLLEKKKAVFTLDYCLKPENAALVYKASRKLGFIPLVSRIALDRPTETPPPGVGDPRARRKE